MEAVIYLAGIAGVIDLDASVEADPHPTWWCLVGQPRIYVQN